MNKITSNIQKRNIGNNQILKYRRRRKDFFSWLVFGVGFFQDVRHSWSSVTNHIFSHIGLFAKYHSESDDWMYIIYSYKTK